MRNRILLSTLPFLLLFLTCVSVAQIAQFVPCKFAEATTVGSSDGIAVSRVTIVEASGEVGATVLIPKAERPMPGMLLTHSAIDGPENRADLLHFAQAMARAGAASIVLDGDLNWKQGNSDNRRAPHLMACAGQWLLKHANLDPRRLVLGGPSGEWGGGDTPNCLPGEIPCWSDIGWLNFGIPGQPTVTNKMLTTEGQYELARAVARWVKLGTLQPEWFAVNSALE